MPAVIDAQRDIEVTLKLEEILSICSPKIFKVDVVNMFRTFEYLLYIFESSDDSSRVADYRSDRRLEAYLSKEDCANLLGRRVVVLEYDSDRHYKVTFKCSD